MAEPLDLRLVRPSTFEPLLGTEFVSEEPPARFLLTDVTRSPIDRNAPREEPFTLTFVAHPGLEQATYKLSHESLGRVDMFLVPVGNAADGQMLYEAVFN